MSEQQNMRKATSKIKWIISGVILVILILVLIGNTVYTISEQEKGVIVNFGVPSHTVDSGLHIKIPFIQDVYKIDTTINGLAIGYDEHDNDSINNESLMITSDFNFVNVDFYVEYKVSSPIDYLYNSDDPVAILKNIVQSCIRTVVGSYDVDRVLTDGKSEIQSKVKEMVVDKLSKQELGLQIVNLTIQDAEPPTADVMQAFKAVETAKQQKETIINNANKYRNEKMPEAQADVDNILLEAKTTKTQRVNEAQAQVALFNAMYKEYKKNPTMTKRRMFYEAMEEILPDLEIIIESGNGDVQKILPLDTFADFNQSSSSSKAAKNTDNTTNSKKGSEK